MKKILSIFNRGSSVSAAAVIISGSYLASRILGLLRDRLLVANFGIGPEADAYTAAFRLPELLFTLLVSGAFAVAFIPVFTDHWQKNEKAKAWQLSSVLLSFLTVGTIAIASIVFVFADPLTRLVAPGFDPERHELTVNLTRIMLITPVLFAVSSLLGSIAQSFNRFVYFAQASVFYNVGIIVGIVFLSPDYSIYGVAYGVVIGAVLQAIIQIAGLIGLGYRFRFSLDYKNKSVRKVFALMIPRSIDQGIDQIHYIVETAIGSRLATGSLASLYYANNLKNVPLVLIGNAIATAAFPRMAARAASGAMEKLIQSFVINTRLILFLVIPAATITVIMRGYIVRLLYGFGDATTANTLGWFAGAIVFQALFFLIARMFYALQDTKTPLYLSLGAIVINIPLAFYLSEIHGVIGLAMAQSIVAAGETILLMGILQKKLGQIGLAEIWRGLYRILLANVIMGSLLYICVARVLPLFKSDIGFAVVGPKFLALGLIAAAAYLIPCYILNLREAHQFTRRLKEQFLRPFNLT